MLFNSEVFLLFLIVVFALYWAIPYKVRWILLLIASYFFYAFYNIKLLFLIVFTTLVSYFCGVFLEKYKTKRARITILIISLFLCLSVLFVFKYLGFLYNVVWDIIELVSNKKQTGYLLFILPVGISFYTFQTMSYIIDVFKGKIKAEKHLGFYALFVCYFPQLVAGPIEKSESIIPQLKERQYFKNIDFYSSFRYLVLGFFKKVAIADIIGIIVNETFENISSSSGLMVLISSILFSFQIYFDFSGYSDIAKGTSFLFGVKLVENFKSPYKSKSVKEFWGRWHISFSSWLKEYIYIPLGGSRVGKVKKYINILIVFLVSGIWHGANYTYIVWGISLAVMQIIGDLTKKYRANFLKLIKLKEESFIIVLERRIITFIFITLTWIMFRSNSITDSLKAYELLFTDISFNLTSIDYMITKFNLSTMLFVYCLLSIPLCLSMEKLKYDFSNSLLYKYKTIRFVIYVVAIFAIIFSWIYLQASDVGSSFIYFQF